MLLVAWHGATGLLQPKESKACSVLHLLRNLRWVRGVPTSLNTVASVRPGRKASTLFTRAAATSSFFRSYSGGLKVCRKAD